MRKCVLATLVFAAAFSACGAFAGTKDTLVVADQYDATTMDPIAHNDYPTSRACAQIYETLIYLNDDGSARSRENLTSLAFSSSPLWNLTPLRI